jgi:hypothetical protein
VDEVQAAYFLEIPSFYNNRRKRTMTRSSRTYHFALAAAVALFAGCEQQPSSRAYVETLGTDTTSVEVFTRTADGFTGDLLVRSPVTRVAHYEATLNSDGTIASMSVDWTTPPENPDGPPAVGFTVTIAGDSATIEARSPDGDRTSTIAVPAGAVPTVGKLPVSYAVFEQAATQAVASGEDVYTLGLVSSRGRVAENAITRVGGDTVSMNFFGSPMLQGVDGSGRVLWRSGQRTTLKVEGAAAGAIDFAGLAADFAARDARGEGMGVASPEATVIETVGGAELMVAYSRPAKRGREIWGGLVPWNEVWRTGANAATSFSSSRDLEIGGVRVPAGDYTLFSIYTPESAQLIINRQTGQWGTMYDEAQDHARIDLMTEALPEMMERFTISIEPTAEGGVIGLSWDGARYYVPFTVR